MPTKDRINVNIMQLLQFASSALISDKNMHLILLLCSTVPEVTQFIKQHQTIMERQ